VVSSEYIVPHDIDDEKEQDGGSRHVLDRVSPPPSDVTSSDSGTKKRETTSRRASHCSDDYDPSIWDFLSPAPDNGDDEEEGYDDDDDDINSCSGEGGTPSHDTVNIRSTELHAQAVLEIVETEISYGNDLATIKHVCKSSFKFN